MSDGFWNAAGQIGSSLINASSQQGINAENIHMMRENRQWTNEETDEARRWDIEQTDKARAYETNLANTAYQRQTQDMIAAGLNPALASQGGGGASTPSSPAPKAGTPPAPGAPNLVAPRIELPDLMSFGVSLKQLEQTDKRLKIEGANSASMIAKNLSEEEVNKMEKILKQKGIFKANMEGKLNKMAERFIDYMSKESRQQINPTPEKPQKKNPAEQMLDDQMLYDQHLSQPQNTGSYPP